MGGGRSTTQGTFREHAALRCRPGVCLPGGVPSLRLRAFDAGQWNTPLQTTVGGRATSASLVLLVEQRWCSSRDHSPKPEVQARDRGLEATACFDYTDRRSGYREEHPMRIHRTVPP